LNLAFARFEGQFFGLCLREIKKSKSKIYSKSKSTIDSLHS